ncbi:hypothetical protein BLNAU_8109 [Blattamonas nauphoetae]|uniref:Uncharacterized protein n=1 Tax=Blattamonas nauphoetae TaxID=2049346 RepID=A0ABQ9Y002_9EUKA|nr:hypothetical protein BLNAU_8109 [Blattamonas nauphoetae]
MALQALSTRCKSYLETHEFLRTLKVPSGSTKRSSKRVPFTERLCSTLTEHVSEMKSLFAESSPSDGTVSALSATLPSESSILNGNDILEVLCAGFSLFDRLLIQPEAMFEDILIGHHFVPLLKSAIIVCLDLLERQESESNLSPASEINLIKILNRSWDRASDCLCNHRGLFSPIAESAFDDPQLCSLLERTCRHSSPYHSCHLRMIINISSIHPHLIPRMLEENLVERVIDTTQPRAVPTSNADFHLRLIRTIFNLIWDPRNIAEDEEERKRIRMLQFERVLTPAKEYLQFILKREEFIPKAKSGNYDLPSRISRLSARTLALERELFEYGEIVETGREEWEVGWLVEKTNEKELGKRLKTIREDDVRMKKDEKSRWKKRVERLREAGHSDAMEGWLTRMDNETQSGIVEYLKRGSSESGMNVRF